MHALPIQHCPASLRADSAPAFRLPRPTSARHTSTLAQPGQGRPPAWRLGKDTLPPRSGPWHVSWNPHTIRSLKRCPSASRAVAGFTGHAPARPSPVVAAADARPHSHPPRRLQHERKACDKMAAVFAHSGIRFRFSGAADALLGLVGVTEGRQLEWTCFSSSSALFSRPLASPTSGPS